MKLSRDQLVQAIACTQRPHPDGPDAPPRTTRLEGPGRRRAERNAVFAAQLARAGLTGPAPIFEGRRLLPRWWRRRPRSTSTRSATAAQQFKINESGVKVYPAVVYAQTAIVAGIALAKSIGSMTGSRHSRSRPTRAARAGRP